jgi:hypothetical protein
MTTHPNLCPDYDEDADNADLREEAARYGAMDSEDRELEDLYRRAQRRFAPLTPIERVTVYDWAVDPFA